MGTWCYIDPMANIGLLRRHVSGGKWRPLFHSIPNERGTFYLYYFFCNKYMPIYVHYDGINVAGTKSRRLIIKWFLHFLHSHEKKNCLIAIKCLILRKFSKCEHVWSRAIFLAKVWRQIWNEDSGWEKKLDVMPKSVQKQQNSSFFQSANSWVFSQNFC